MDSTYEFSISHASEDKESIARPLAQELRARGFRVWFDEFELKVGQSLSRAIDVGLAECRYGVVILSPSFFSRRWPERELSGLVSREIASGKVTILPIWHGVSHRDVAGYSPILADKVALKSSQSVQELADEIASLVDAENVEMDTFSFDAREVGRVSRESNVEIISPTGSFVRERAGDRLEVTFGVVFDVSCPPAVVNIEVQGRWDLDDEAPVHMLRHYRPANRKGSRQLMGMIAPDLLAKHDVNDLQVSAAIYLFDNETGAMHFVRESKRKSITLL